MKNKIFTLGGELENLTINQKEEAEKTWFCKPNDEKLSKRQ